MTVTWASPTVTWDSLTVPWNALSVPATVGKVTVGVWQKLPVGWGRVAQIDTWLSMEAEARHNEPGTWSLLLPVDVQTVRLTKTRLVTFDFRGTRFTGLVENPVTQSDASGNLTVEASGVGAWALLNETVVFPDPGSDADAQLTTRYQATGPAETVLRALALSQMVTRLGYDMVFPTDAGRGGTVGVNLKFGDPLGPAVAAAANTGGVGVRVGLVNTTSSTRAELRCEFYVPADRSNRVRLSHKLGTLGAWKMSDQAPTLTRAYVAGAVEDTPRKIASVSVAADSLTIVGADARHNLKTGSRIKFVRGNPPDPLEPNTSYFAIRVDANTFKVALTRRKALAGTPVNLTTEGGGPITVVEVNRRIVTVIESDRETEWGRIRESIVDAREEDDQDSDAALVAKGTESLLESGTQRGFELEAVEAAGMRLGDHYSLGDDVLVEPMPGVSSVERLSGVKLAGSSAGLTVTLLPGDPNATDPMFRQAALVRDTRRRQASLEREEG